MIRVVLHLVIVSVIWFLFCITYGVVWTVQWLVKGFGRKW